MTVIALTSKTWRQLAIEYGPKDNLINVMRDRYGLVRVIPNTKRYDRFGFQYYEIVDKAKYTMFLLKWEH